MDLKLKNNSSLVITSALPQQIGSVCTSLFINGCPNVSGIAVLRSCPNLNRVFVNISSVTGSMSELVSYANIDNGFDITENFVDKPYIIGTFTVNDYYSQAQLNACTNAFYNDALTIITDPSKNIDTILTNAGVQVLDEDKANFNPAVAIKLQTGGFGTLLDVRCTEHGGKWFVLKSDLANITNNTQNNTKLSFEGVSSLTDSNAIVTDDATESYDFESFDELEYFTGLSTIRQSFFKNCSMLKSITIPSNITTIEQESFVGTTLESITFKNTNPISFDSNAFNGITTLQRIYIENINAYCQNSYGNTNANPLNLGHHLYNLDGTEITNITFPQGITKINGYALQGGSSITSITIPDSVTTILDLAFASSGITSIIIPDSVTSFNQNALQNCSSLMYIEGPGFTRDGANWYNNAGASGATILVRGDIIFTGTTSYNARAFGACANVIIRGNYQRYDSSASPGGPSDVFTSFRIKGNYSNLGTGSLCYGPQFRFCEINGTYTSKLSYAQNTGQTNGLIIHLGYNGVAGTYANLGNLTRLTKVYVGDGSSRANDQAVLNQYIVDSDFAALNTSNKLDTWYDYHGEFRTYTVTDTLTNCVNTNPALYPYITRGNSYQTTIEAEDGYTLGTVTVQMLDTDSTSVTYDTLVNITNDVYNSSTGEINIPSVTGNIVITATAS